MDRRKNLYCFCQQKQPYYASNKFKNEPQILSCLSTIVIHPSAACQLQTESRQPNNQNKLQATTDYTNHKVT